MSNPTVLFSAIVSTATGENSVEVPVISGQNLLLSYAEEAAFSPAVSLSGEQRSYMKYLHEAGSENNPLQWFTQSRGQITVHSQPVVEGADHAAYSKSFADPSPAPLNLRVTINQSSGGVMIVGTIDIDTEIIS